jgi:hypothetical protein
VSLAEVHEHHRQQVNNALRRPGMYGPDESSLRLLMDAMAVVDGRREDWAAEFDALRSRDAFAPTGVAGAVSTVLPSTARLDAAASVYARVAHRLGWLDLDRALSAGEYGRLVEAIPEWVAEDRTLTAVIDSFGDPSVWIGGSNPHYPKTLVYASSSPADEHVCFHLWNDADTHPEPVLLAVGHRPGRFPDSFSFTPEGRLRRPRDDRPTVWLFHGDRARHAAGAFTTRADGLAWAAEHEVSGVLAEYPIGGSYDVAVREGRFTPTRPHHGTAEHVADFSPGLEHVHLTDGKPR